MAKTFDVLAAAGEICSALSDAGFEYYTESDNRGGKSASQYIMLRKPIAGKVRVSNHRSNYVKRNKNRSRHLMLDVGPHALTAAQAIQLLTNPK